MKICFLKFCFYLSKQFGSNTQLYIMHPLYRDLYRAYVNVQTRKQASRPHYRFNLNLSKKNYNEHIIQYQKYPSRPVQFDITKNKSGNLCINSKLVPFTRTKSKRTNGFRLFNQNRRRNDRLGSYCLLNVYVERIRSIVYLNRELMAHFRPNRDPFTR